MPKVEEEFAHHHVFLESDANLISDLVHLIDSIGTEQFYHAAAKLIARTLGSDRYMVMRYAQYVKPQFLVNEALSPSAMHHYETSLYRIDPLLRMARSGDVTRVLTFDQLKRETADQLFFIENYSTAQINDEVVVMLPAVGGVWTAICIDKSLDVYDTCFEPSEVEQVKKLYPVLDSVHNQHIERCIFDWRAAYLNDSEIAMMITDSSGNTVFRNANWKQTVDIKTEGYILSKLAKIDVGQIMLDSNAIVHCRRLPENNSVAPYGHAFLLEQKAPGYLDTTDNQLIQKLAETYELTPKETEVVAHILRGLPPTLIAEKMGVTVGTVRNHKHRLYFKLDISTERELFTTFINIFLRGAD